MRKGVGFRLPLPVITESGKIVRGMGFHFGGARVQIREALFWCVGLPRSERGAPSIGWSDVRNEVARFPEVALPTDIEPAPFGGILVFHSMAT